MIIKKQNLLKKKPNKQTKKTAWYWYSDRQVDQCNRIKDPEMNPHTITCSLSKQLKPSSGKQTFSSHGTGSPGGQHVEEFKSIHSYFPVQSSRPSGSRTST